MKMFFKVMALVVFVLANVQVAAWGEGLKKSFDKVGNEIRNAEETVRDQFNGKAKARAAAQQKVNEAASLVNQKEIDVTVAQQKLGTAQADLEKARVELIGAKGELQRLN